MMATPITVCLVGAESTGKTTLAQNLARHFHTVWIPEYGRIYAEGKLHLPDYSTWHTHEFADIARAQTALIKQLSPRANKYLFIDTDAFATSIWHRRYMNSRSPAVERLAKKTLADFYLVTAPDVAFVQDGTRDGEHIREWMHETFLSELERLKKPYAVITGPYEERLERALEVFAKTQIEKREA